MSVQEKSPEGVESFLSGKMSRVDVGAIQAELRRLWLQAATSDHEESDHPQISRACSCNLVLFTEHEDAQTVQSNILDSVVLQHPARAIMTILDNQAKERGIEAWVSARCHMGAGARQICSEQITVVAQNAKEEELTSVIDSLILGDQPTFVWWTVPDISGDRIGAYLACARRVIVDSSLAPFSLQYLCNLHRLFDNFEGCLAVSDLNWARLLGIRRALAEEFERSPLQLTDLHRIAKITISSNGQELQADDCSVQSLLLLGWIASRLDWQPVYLGRENGAVHSGAKFKRTDGKIVETEFHSTTFDHVPPGTVFHVVVQLEDGRSVEVYRDPAVELGSLVVIVRENTKRVRELIADESPSDIVALMSDELDELGPDTVFGESLAKAFELVEAAVK